MIIAQRHIGRTLFAQVLGFLCRTAIFLASRLHHQYQYHRKRSPQTEGLSHHAEPLCSMFSQIEGRVPERYVSS